MVDKRKKFFQHKLNVNLINQKKIKTETKLEIGNVGFLLTVNKGQQIQAFKEAANLILEVSFNLNLVH